MTVEGCHHSEALDNNGNLRHTGQQRLNGKLEPFIGKVVDVMEVGRREEKDILLSLLLSQVIGGGQLGSGTQVSGGTPAISPDNTLATLFLATALFSDSDSDWDQTIPILLLALFGTQGFGSQAYATQGNIPSLLLLLPLLLPRKHPKSKYAKSKYPKSKFWEEIKKDPEVLDTIKDYLERHQGTDIKESLDSLLKAATKTLDKGLEEQAGRASSSSSKSSK